MSASETRLGSAVFCFRRHRVIFSGSRIRVYDGTKLIRDQANRWKSGDAEDSGVIGRSYQPTWSDSVKILSRCGVVDG